LELSVREHFVTIEKVCFVAPEDFKAVKIACKNCKSFTVVPINEAASLAPLLERNCISCGTPSGIRKGTKEWEDILLVGEKLANLQATMRERGIIYSLRIECPTIV
jgi:hypothetical protein